MKKVLQQGARYIFSIFGMAVFGLLMSMTYSALGRIFPDQSIYQIWGLILFDIAALCWASAFTYHSQTIEQYAISGIGFIVSFIGTLVLVAAEVLLGGQALVSVDADLGQWLVYSFITITALHVSFLYVFHFGNAELKKQIEIGIAKGSIQSQALKQAVHEIGVQENELARSIREGLVDDVHRDIGYSAKGTIFEPVQKNTAPVSFSEPIFIPEPEPDLMPELEVPISNEEPAPAPANRQPFLQRIRRRFRKN